MNRTGGGVQYAKLLFRCCSPTKVKSPKTKRKKQITRKTTNNAIKIIFLLITINFKLKFMTKPTHIARELWQKKRVEGKNKIKQIWFKKVQSQID